MNFTPKNVFEGENSDGTTFTMAEWDFNTLANLQIGSLFLMLIAGSLLSTIISPILLIMCVLTITGRVKVINIMGIVIGIYFLIDYKNDWLCFGILKMFLEPSQLKIVFAMNVASLGTHILFLVFGKIIAKSIVSEEGIKNAEPVTYLLGVVAMFAMIFYFAY